MRIDMPIDPATQAFLDMLKTSGGRPFHQMSADEARAAIVGLSKAIGGVGTDVHQVTDRRILASLRCARPT